MVSARKKKRKRKEKENLKNESVILIRI